MDHILHILSDVMEIAQSQASMKDWHSALRIVNKWKINASCSKLYSLECFHNGFLPTVH